MPTVREYMLARRHVMLWLGAILLVAPLATAAQEVMPEPKLVDRIVAIVDEEMILQSDLEREIELYHLERQYAGVAVTANKAEIQQEVLDRLVESKLIIAAAKQADISVEEEVIEQGVEARIDQLIEHFGSREALERELLQNGMTLVDYQGRLATQMTDQHYLRAVVSRFIRPKIEVLENEILEYYENHKDELPTAPDSLTLANILIPIQPSLQTRQAIQQKVSAVQQALQAGQPFDEVAREYSDGPNANRGGKIGVVQRGDLFDSNLETVVFQLAVGEISQPVLTQRGVHLVRVDAITENGRAISQIFFPLEVSQDDVAVAQQQADTVYQRLLAGEPFSLVAAEVSGDAVSARQGGHLGKFRLEDLSPEFQEALQDKMAGELTEPVLTPTGLYIFLVQERTLGRQFTYEEVKEDIRSALESQKMEVELTRYVETLRQRFFIDMKG